MTAVESVNPVEPLRQQLAEGSPDVLAAMVTAFASRNGYRPRSWEARAGTVELAIPKLRQGTDFPNWPNSAVPACPEIDQPVNLL